MDYTLAYSEGVQGWTSFYSYKPEMMIGMNSYLYSFKNGELYRHSVNDRRNNFYGQDNPSTITAVINDEPTAVKNFKTISLEGNDSWDAELKTDLSTGFIDSTWFSLKEGNYFGYIRNNSVNLSSRASQGIGSVNTVTIQSSTQSTLSFTFDVGTMISLNDSVFNAESGVPVFIGTVISVSGFDVIINTTGADGAASNGNYIMYGRNPIAESSGLRGYYMEYKLENNSIDFVELFGIDSSLFKSYP